MAKARWRKVGLVSLVAALCAAILGIATACGGTTKYLVTFYDGETVIATQEVEEGQKAESFVPSDKGYDKENYEFAGWFATSDFTHDWSFDTAIDRDTNVYSQWVSAAEDTRQWLIAGSSSAGGPLAAIGWNGGAIEGENGNILTKSPDKNEFTITIDLYVGDPRRSVSGGERIHGGARHGTRRRAGQHHRLRERQLYAHSHDGRSR